MAQDLFSRKFTKDDASGNPISDWKWLIENGTKVREQGTAQNQETTIHTVTTGKVLYIFSITLGAQNNANLSSIATCSIEIDDTELVAANPGALNNGHEYLGLSFAMPILVAAGKTIQVTSNRTSCFARGTVIGYEI